MASARVPTFAYEFNDDQAPPRFGPALNPPIATHGSELAYLFDLPEAPAQVSLSPEQEQLADTMQAAWARFAATGDPSTRGLPWPSFNQGGRIVSLVSPAPRPETSKAFASTHHAGLWLAK